MVFMTREGLVVAALLASVRASWKVPIYYLNGALLKLNRYALYLELFLGDETLDCDKRTHVDMDRQTDKKFEIVI